MLADICGDVALSYLASFSSQRTLLSTEPHEDHIKREPGECLLCDSMWRNSGRHGARLHVGCPARFFVSVEKLFSPSRSPCTTRDSVAPGTYDFHCLWRHPTCFSPCGDARVASSVPLASARWPCERWVWQESLCRASVSRDRLLLPAAVTLPMVCHGACSSVNTLVWFGARSRARTLFELPAISNAGNSSYLEEHRGWILLELRRQVGSFNRQRY